MEFRVGLHEVRQLQPFLIARINDGITLHIPPEMITILNHRQHLLTFFKIRMGDFFHLQHLHDL